MKKYGLPTYPIHNSMDIGYERDDDELEWLLNHGHFENGSLSNPQYIYKITCIDFVKNAHPDRGMYALLFSPLKLDLTTNYSADIIVQAKTLDKLVSSRKIVGGLSYWQWYEQKEEEDENKSQRSS